MILKLCSIYDKRALNYGAPMAFPTLGVAERSFMDAITSPDQQVMNKHPEDYTLYYIGEFDSDTGKITQAEKHTVVAEGFAITQ